MGPQKIEFVKLPVTIIKQGGRYIAYSPALDISTSGKNEQEAKKRFSELSDIFFEELVEKGTLEEALRDLGWIKMKKNWEPPQIIRQEPLKIGIPVAG